MLKSGLCAIFETADAAVRWPETDQGLHARIDPIIAGCDIPHQLALTGYIPTDIRDRLSLNGYEPGVVHLRLLADIIPNRVMACSPRQSCSPPSGSMCRLEALSSSRGFSPPILVIGGGAENNRTTNIPHFL
jgi:hypothetical protein